MNPKYRFFLQVNDGEKIPVNPIYGDDMTLDYEMESALKLIKPVGCLLSMIKFTNKAICLTKIKKTLLKCKV